MLVVVLELGGCSFADVCKSTMQPGRRTHVSIGLTGVVCCAAPGTVLAAGVMPVLMDSTSYGCDAPPGSNTLRPCSQSGRGRGEGAERGQRGGVSACQDTTKVECY